MNERFESVARGLAKMYHGDKAIDARVCAMREEIELIHEVALYYFGDGDLFFTEESSGVREEVGMAHLPWSYDCPFCDSSKRLFRIFTHLNLFYCYHCERYGDEIGLIKQIEFCSTDEAMEKLEEIFEYLSRKEDEEDEHV